jgi:hypothetical protein
MEAVCTGDEKASPVKETPSPSINQHTEAIQKSVPEQARSAVPTAAVPSAQIQSTAAPSISSPSQQSQDTVIHRQGRQQYQKGMDEAKAARLKLIEELQQSQPAP